jgi:hypothetical protein
MHMKAKNGERGSSQCGASACGFVAWVEAGRGAASSADDAMTVDASGVRVVAGCVVLDSEAARRPLLTTRYLH